MLEQIFEKLSPEARFQRFFAHKKELSPADLSTLTDCDGENQIAIAALTRTGKVEEGVGVARFVRLREEPRNAEIALAVIDAVQRHGIGRLLLHRLIEAAMERGIRQLQGYILADNLAMTALARQFAAETQQASSRLPGATLSTVAITLRLVGPASA